MMTASLPDGLNHLEIFLAYHKNQLESSGVPPHFWKVLCKKLQNQIFDAGHAFSLMKIDNENAVIEGPAHKVVVSCDEGIDPLNSQHIYLIDHAWTYRVDNARQNLREIPGLLDRMMTLMGIEKTGGNDLEYLIEKVFDEMWRFSQTYALQSSSVEDSVPIWYVMDEFGSAIQHSCEPNFRTVPFYYIPEQITYTLLFPVKLVSNGEEATRDYVESNMSDPLTRKALLLPWRAESFLLEDYTQNEPNDHYFLEGHVIESLPNTEDIENYVPLTVHEQKLKVYSQYEFINNYLTHPKFEITSTEEDADIFWYVKHFKGYKEFSLFHPRKFVNQFPFENVITIKDLLCIVCRRAAKTSVTDRETLNSEPIWLPTTYNLKTELPKFVSYFQNREERNLDNHWICKPWNLARGLDTHITNNINYILRLALSGPKICQKYLHDPVLFNRPDCGLVKFDIRFVVLLKSVKPLISYAYRNFFLRFANNVFELKNFDEYERHFTVMNYNESARLCRMLCHDFVREFELQYPNYEWKKVERNIFSMLHEVFVAATSKNPPCGIAHNPQSRALYAADIMLVWNKDENRSRVMQPKLLEINWTPDCKRACEYYPSFYNDIFSLLFLNEENNDVFELLK